MAKYPGTLETNNINEYGIVKADQIQGHRIVDSSEDLTKLTTAQVSVDKTHNNGRGALWYVNSSNQFFYLGGTGVNSGDPSDYNNWYSILTFINLKNEGCYVPLGVKGINIKDIGRIDVDSINGYLLGSETASNSFLTKSQIENIIHDQTSSYLYKTSVLTKSDIENIIQSCV